MEFPHPLISGCVTERSKNHHHQQSPRQKRQKPRICQRGRVDLIHQPTSCKTPRERERERKKNSTWSWSGAVSKLEVPSPMAENMLKWCVADASYGYEGIFVFWVVGAIVVVENNPKAGRVTGRTNQRALQCSSFCTFFLSIYFAETGRSIE